MSQATCKVCQNKILIKRPPEGTPVDELISAPGVPMRQPMATPTRISGGEDESEPTIADPEPPPIRRAGLSGASSTLSAPLPGEGSGLSQLPETELSNSWREAILDNRPTVAMLKKMGLPGPAEGSTASGPAVTMGPPVGAMPPPPSPAAWAAPSPAAAAAAAAAEVMEPTVFSDPPAPGPIPPASWAAAPAGPSAAIAPTAEQMEPTVFSDESPGGAPTLANAPPFAKASELATGRTAGTITSVQQMPTGTTPKPSVRVATPPRPFVKEGSSQLLSFATGVGASVIVAAGLWNGSWGAGLSGWIAFGIACFIAAGSLMNSLLRGPGFLAVFSVGFLASLVAVIGMLAVFLTGGPRTRILAETHPFLAPLAAFERSLSKGLPVATPAPEATPDAMATDTVASPSTPVESPAPPPTP